MNRAFLDTSYFFEDFNGNLAPPLTASTDGGIWVKADTSAAGAPTVATVAAPGSPGEIALTMVSTVEAENLCLYFGDHLAFDIDLIQYFETRLKITSAVDATTSALWGMTGNRHDVHDTIAQTAIFRVILNNTVVVESDDGTNDNNDISTGSLVTGTGYKRYAVSFANGSADVRFFMDNANGSLARVAAGTTFDMSNYTGGLQPNFQIQKTSDSNVDVLTVDYVYIKYKRS